MNYCLLIICCVFQGCPLANGRLLRVGEQFANDQCTRLCTCDEDGVIGCLPLCPSSQINEDCEFKKKITAPAGPPGSKCTCEQISCEGMYFFAIRIKTLGHLVTYLAISVLNVSK
jgi:hypothetical protein